MTSLHIAVIGAGIAGLSCATALQGAGLHVRVFDKSRGPGGRMSTRRGSGWHCDHGAPFFSANDPAFRAEVARWVGAGVAAPWHPEMHRINADGTSDRCGATEYFVGAPRMTAPAAWLASTLNLRTDLAINAMRRDDSGWRLTAEGIGDLEHGYDAVVLAVPAPQAAQLLREAAPQQAMLAERATMEGCWAMMLQYPAPLALGFDAATINHGPLRLVVRDSAKPGRGGIESWLLHASAAWSQAHIECDVGTVAAQLLSSFAALGAPAPERWSAHRWRYASTAVVHAEACSWEAGEGVGMCGDWLNGGTVEAAWLSGQALARRVQTSYADMICQE